MHLVPASRTHRPGPSPWIPPTLAPELDLQSSVKNKSGLFIGDLGGVLHRRATRRSARTSSSGCRWPPSSSTRVPRRRGRAPSYTYTTATSHSSSAPSTPGSTRPCLGVVITLRKTKRTKGRSIPRSYGFHEEDTLLRDPQISPRASPLPTANNLRGLDDIYNLAVPAGNSQTRIPWDKDWRDKPIFRDDLGRGRHAVLAIDQVSSLWKGEDAPVWPVSGAGL